LDDTAGRTLPMRTVRWPSRPFAWLSSRSKSWIAAKAIGRRSASKPLDPR